MIEKIKKLIWRIKFEIEWGKAKKEGVIVDEEMFNYFYCTDNFNIGN